MNQFELALTDWQTNGGLYIAFFDNLERGRSLFDYIKSVVEISRFSKDYKIVNHNITVKNSDNEFKIIKLTEEGVDKIRGFKSKRITFHVFDETDLLTQIIQEFLNYKFTTVNQCRLIIE